MRRGTFPLPFVARLVLLAAAGCAGGSASDTADRFMDYYFIEADQQKALPLTAGPAQAKLKAELKSVKDIRRTGYGSRQARGKVFYERVSADVTDDKKAARFVYDVTLGDPGSTVARHVTVMVRLRGGWHVVNFLTGDGKARLPGPRKAE